ncbi:uncharacterized protein EAE97_004606 [Botrytis byssoidea]|uniref:Uncharacterized protein n=1 Tax=Botrytis byssoidea TaxID=139641 RepID=A0A9P5M476_9HELO|nr:uncharacterized protein EAE97_004606 [Botrytis byssoidea]KAF7947357.1 hypothetical protein EAE97_004606 [Botrytis byssoidea]
MLYDSSEDCCLPEIPILGNREASFNLSCSPDDVLWPNTVESVGIINEPIDYSYLSQVQDNLETSPSSKSISSSSANLPTTLPVSSSERSADFHQRRVEEYTKEGWHELLRTPSREPSGIRKLRQKEIQRIIVLRSSAAYLKLQYGEHHTAASLAYERGDEAIEPCSYCRREDRGTFKNCVVMPGRFSGACTNCKFVNRGSLFTLHNKNAVKSQSSSQSSSPSEPCTKINPSSSPSEPPINITPSSRSSSPLEL